MKEITILSGKGGTGKTSITAAIAALSDNAVYCDNDVDAADLHLLFQPEIKEVNNFFSGYTATINQQTCTGCEECVKHCRFDAIHKDDDGLLNINPFQCEGCRLCERICPAQAITSTRNNENYWYVSTSRFGTLVHACMGPGEENSGKLVSQVRKKAREIATDNNMSYIINDGPPGIGCATISSLSGTNKVLVVIEPTRSGLHDAIRLMDLAETFQTEICAVINKYDINIRMANEIKTYLYTRNIPLLAQIPFDKEMVEAMDAGKTIIEFNKGSEITTLLEKVWNTLKK